MKWVVPLRIGIDGVVYGWLKVDNNSNAHNPDHVMIRVD